jgi:hypothetical protein
MRKVQKEEDIMYQFYQYSGELRACLKNRRSIIVSGEIFFSSPQQRNRLWGQIGLLSNGYRGSFPGIKRPDRVTVSRLRIHGSVPPLRN